MNEEQKRLGLEDALDILKSGDDRFFGENRLNEHGTPYRLENAGANTARKQRAIQALEMTLKG